ncbi:hypothetical protein [Neobacillus sp. LXY-4]
MAINDKVLYSGNVYKIIFDYQNGRYEIMKEDTLRSVLLVTDHEITKLT